MWCQDGFVSCGYTQLASLCVCSCLPCVFCLSPVRSVLQRKMANGGGGSSDYESFEEEEEEEPRPPPTPPPAIPRTKGAVKSAARPPAPRGAARSAGVKVAAGVKVEAPSSPSVSPAPARREARKAEADSPPAAAPAKAAPPEKRPRVRGRRAWGSQMCDICWNEVGGFPSALDQHRRWNLECLRWQHYNEGDCSWEEARDRAMQTKMRRDARAIVEQSRTREPSAGGKRWPRDDLRDQSAHMGRSAPKSVIVKVHEKKRKKRRSHKSKRDEDESPTPEVPDRDRRRRDRPPSSSDEEPRTSKRPRRRQLVITLPEHVRF